MDTVHAIAIDRNRRVYVSDRSNSRIQVFDENGKFVDAWPNVRRPYSFLLTEDQHLWVADGVTQKFTKFDVNGKLPYRGARSAPSPAGSGACTSSTSTAKEACTRPTRYFPRVTSTN
jgi:hypothetical protein